LEGRTHDRNDAEILIELKREGRSTQAASSPEYVRIPLTLNAKSGMNPALLGDPEHHRSVAALASRLCKKRSASSREIRYEAQRRKTAASRERGAGKGRQVPSPPQHTVARSATSAPAFEDNFRFATTQAQFVIELRPVPPPNRSEDGPTEYQRF
jgi:hypothetical protein